MSDGRKWRYTTCLVLGALASICSSLWGGLWVFGAMFMQYSTLHILTHLLLLFGFPLFVLAVALSRQLIIGLWTIALVYPLAVILIDRDVYTTESFLMFEAGIGTIASLLAAALLQYGVRPLAVPGGAESHGDEYAAKG
jgi:hypothetical protein